MAMKESKELVRREPARELTPFDEMEKWFEEVMRRPFSALAPGWWPRMRFPETEAMPPSVDIYEEGDDVVVKAEVAGMRKDEIEVNLSDSTITISGEKKKEEQVEQKNYYRMERSYGSFTRSFQLPAEVESGRAKATFRDGVLEIRIPKSEESKQKVRKIPIE